MDRDYHAPNCTCLFCERYKRVLGPRLPTPATDEPPARKPTAAERAVGLAIIACECAVLGYILFVWLYR